MKSRKRKLKKNSRVAADNDSRFLDECLNYGIEV